MTGQIWAACYLIAFYIIQYFLTHFPQKWTKSIPQTGWLDGWMKPWHLGLPLSGSHRMLLPASLYSITLINNTGSHNASPIPRGAYGCWVWVNTIRLILNSPSICVGSSILDHYDDRRRTITSHCHRQLPWKRISSISAVFRILTSILSRHKYC